MGFILCKKWNALWLWSNLPQESSTEKAAGPFVFPHASFTGIINRMLIKVMAVLVLFPKHYWKLSFSTEAEECQNIDPVLWGEIELTLVNTQLELGDK